MKIDTLLTRLNKVRKVGNFRWVACCPAHDDSTPSLSIGTTPDGKTLLYCFGCGAKGPKILEVLGLELSDVQDFIGDREKSHPIQDFMHQYDRDEIRCEQKNKSLWLEVTIGNLLAGVPLTDDERQHIVDALGYRHG